VYPAASEGVCARYRIQQQTDACVKAHRYLPLYPVSYLTYIHPVSGFAARNADKLHIDVYQSSSGIAFKIMNNSIIEDNILTIRSKSPIQVNFKEFIIGI
jgi:hypothetical protein